MQQFSSVLLTMPHDEVLDHITALNDRITDYNDQFNEITDIIKLQGSKTTSDTYIQCRNIAEQFKDEMIYAAYILQLTKSIDNTPWDFEAQEKFDSYVLSVTILEKNFRFPPTNWKLMDKMFTGNC